MTLQLETPAKRGAAFVICFAAAFGYFAASSSQVLAAYFSESRNPKWMRRAARLDPGDADIRYKLGRFELLAGHSSEKALPWLESATELNPHVARYWTDLALAQESEGDVRSESVSLRRALQADSHSPEIAWHAANLYLSQGAIDDAMKQFHVVLENSPELTLPALRTCWKIRPDIDYLLADVVPPAVYAPLLQFLISQNEIAASEKVWQQIFSIQQPVHRDDLLEYTKYLILHREVDQAARVWREAAGIASLQSYEPSSENLLVNGDFDLDLLNGGFDWVHQKTEGVSLALDPSQPHASSRSLRVTFEGPGIYDAGISQVVAVEPNTSYEFSAFYKAADMDGAGGMELAIQDAYKGTSFLMSEDLRDADFWKKTGGSFTTAPDTELLIVRIVRAPAGSPIRGTLWIDGLQLVPSGSSVNQIAASSAARERP